MHRRILPFFSTLLAVCILMNLLEIANSQCCVQFAPNHRQCLVCPQGMHLYRGNCLFDVENCLKYQGGFDCKECIIDSIFHSHLNKCVRIDWGDQHIFYQTQIQNVILSEIIPNDTFENIKNAIQIQLSSQIRRNSRNIDNAANFKNKLYLKSKQAKQYLYSNIRKQDRTIIGLLYSVQSEQPYNHGKSIVSYEYEVKIIINPNEEKSYKIFNFTKLSESIKYQLPNKTQIDFENNVQHYYQTQIIRFFAMRKQPDIGELAKGYIINDKNKIDPSSEYIEYQLEYSSKRKGHKGYEVIARITNQQEVTIISIKRKQDKIFNQIQTVKPQDQFVNEKNTPSKTNYDEKNYKQISMQYFNTTLESQILLNFINSQQHEKYRHSDLKWIKFQQQGHKKKYELCFASPAQGQWLIRCSIQNSFIITIQSQEQLSPPILSSQKSAKKQNDQRIQISGDKLLKNMYYLYGLSELQGQSGNIFKYLQKENIIKAEEKINNQEGFCQFWVSYQLENQEIWDVYLKVQTGDLKVLSAREALKSSKISTQTNKMPQDNSENKPQQKNTPVAKQLQKIKPQSQEQPQKLTVNKQNSLQKDPKKFPDTNQVAKIIPLSPKSQTPEPTLPPVIKDTPAQEKKAPIPTAIINAAIGLQTLPSPHNQINKDLESVKQTTQSTNGDKQLKNCSLVAAYYQLNSFVCNYYLFYQDKFTKEIFQSRISRDLLRRRNYVISFSRLGY